MVPFSSLVDHLKDVHGCKDAWALDVKGYSDWIQFSTVITSTPNPFDSPGMSRSRWYPKLLAFDGQTFLLLVGCKRPAAGDNWELCSVLSVVAGEETARRWVINL